MIRGAGVQLTGNCPVKDKTQSSIDPTAIRNPVEGQLGEGRGRVHISSFIHTRQPRPYPDDEENDDYGD
jgi:hypothetical protein